MQEITLQSITTQNNTKKSLVSIKKNNRFVNNCYCENCGELQHIHWVKTCPNCGIELDWYASFLDKKWDLEFE